MSETIELDVENLFLPAVRTNFYHSRIYPEFIQSLSRVYPRELLT